MAGRSTRHLCPLGLAGAGFVVRGRAPLAYSSCHDGPLSSSRPRTPAAFTLARCARLRFGLRVLRLSSMPLAAEETPPPNHRTSEVQMKRVTGIGGIFFKARDAPALQAGYKRHLAIDVQDWGGTAFTWADSDGKPTGGTTVWSVGPEEGDQFAPSRASFMVNYRVEDLHAVVTALKAEGCNVLDKIDDSEYGKFAWVIDPEGNKVELWQPPAGQ